MQHVGLIGHCLRPTHEFMTGVSGNGAERAKTRVERSVSGGPRSGNGAVIGGQKNQV